MMKDILFKLQEILGMVHRLNDDAAAERVRAVERDEAQGLAMVRLQRQLEMLRLAQRTRPSGKIRREGEQRP